MEPDETPARTRVMIGAFFPPILAAELAVEGVKAGIRLRGRASRQLENPGFDEDVTAEVGSAVAAVAPQAAPADVAGRLAQIASLHDAGVLTDAEYAAKRAGLVAQL